MCIFVVLMGKRDRVYDYGVELLYRVLVSKVFRPPSL